MPLSIGSNVSSLIAQRRLAEGTQDLSKIYERLSSGQRINRSSDDAAGLAISESLNSDKRVFNQGVRNFNDGLSLLTIADSAIENLSTIVIRLKELAEQSANGTYSVKQRAALDKEAQALSKEYTRIVHSTKFNGVHLLNGSLGDGLRLQGGFGVSGGIFSGIGGAIGSGSFSYSSSHGDGGSSNHATGDFNGDGILDVVSSDGALNVLIGTGAGNFKASVSYQASGVSTFVQVGDFNGDGVLDLVSIGNHLNILLGRGDGTFAQGATAALGSGAIELTIGDFNGDGNLDVASVNQVDARVDVLIGNGDGTFRPRVSYLDAFQPLSIASGDLNNDGILDLVTADSTSSSLSIRLGNGDGTFKSLTGIGTGDLPMSVRMGDFNGDGNLDLVSANFNDSTLSVHLGNGNGTFKAFSALATGSSHGSVAIGDFNGDGHLDLVASGAGDPVVIIGNGNGTFQPYISYIAGPSPGYVTSGDADGDGVLDLIISDVVANSIYILGGRARDGAGPLLPFDLTTMAGARQALPVFDKKIQQLASQRGKIGAFQARLNLGINNLMSASEQYSAAEGRIRNADIAEESSKLIRTNILQQVASQVLKQSNLQPELAVRLLS